MRVDTRARAQKLGLFFPRQSSKAVQFLYLLGCAEEPIFSTVSRSSLAGACVAAADDCLVLYIFCPEVGPCVNKRGGTD